MAQSIEIRGIPELFAKLGSATAIRTLRPPMRRAVFRLQNAMAVYPPPIGPGVWKAKTSRKQKRAFFALLRAGRIDGSRTGTLGRRWTTKVDEDANGLVGTVGNNTSYGPFVQSSMFQVAFQVGRWQTDAEVVAIEQATIVADFERAIQEALG